MPSVILSTPDIVSAKQRPEGDISSSFGSFSEYTSLSDGTFEAIKKELAKDPSSLEASWNRLKVALRDKLHQFKDRSSDVIPTVEVLELQKLSGQDLDKIRESGCLVIRGVIPLDEARALENEVKEYIAQNPQTKGFPADKKVVYELYWSKAQIKARGHPNTRKSTDFVNSLWHASPETRISLANNLVYADRLRIRPPGDTSFNLGPHVDGGSLERWEDPHYSECYRPIFEGRWEDFDPYDASHRVNVDMNRYDSNGNCNIFRLFQGWMALSDVAPRGGLILFAPAIKEFTAYMMLKPFFDDDGNFRTDLVMPGSYPGKSQEFNAKTHPEIDLAKIMVTVPEVHPGDMVFWHCDMIHKVDSIHEGLENSSVLYIPAAPLCEMNVKYAHLQRETFLQGITPPDFPGFPRALGETTHVGRAVPKDIEVIGGDDAMRQAALLPLIDKDSLEGERVLIQMANQLFFE